MKMEKMTRKLADTFEELNQLLTQELNNFYLRTIKSEDFTLLQVEKAADSPI